MLSGNPYKPYFTHTLSRYRRLGCMFHEIASLENENQDVGDPGNGAKYEKLKTQCQ